MSLWQRHQIFEKNSILLVLGILVVIAIGGLVEITPLFYLKNTIEKVGLTRRSNWPAATSTCARVATTVTRR
jgi:cbb3-type cytochrome oxidase cytochrome c subunit